MLPVIPETMQKLLLTQYGESLTQEIAAGFVSKPVTLRVNRLKSTMDEVLSALNAAGLTAERIPWFEDALILPRSTGEAQLQALPLYEAGGFYLQGLSAMLPPIVLGAKPGETILDMAAAPGGKTTQIASMTDGGALITACERDRIRAERLKFNLERQGASRCNVMNQDARQLDDFFSFDRILLDAPCTGSGTLILEEGQNQRRMDDSWIRKTAATQKAMLDKALRLLKPGHEMVYSTCSILSLENEGVLKSVLPKYRAEIVPVDKALTAQLPVLPVSIEGTLCVRPTAEYEGFFVAKIKKGKK